MLIETKVKFKKDGLTVTQQINQDDSAPSEPLVSGNSLKASIAQSKAANAAVSGASQPLSGGGPSDKPGTGPGIFGSPTAPVTIIGPIFFGCSINCNGEEDDTGKDSSKEKK